MDKEKKLSSLLEKLGLTPKEAVINWVRNGVIDLQDIQRTIEKMRKEIVFITSEADIVSGMFLYKNGKISATYTDGQCSAVILKVNRDSLVMMCLEKANLPFCSQGFSVDTIGFKSGLNTTHFIRQMADAAQAESEAATYCLEYEDVFVGKKQAFMLTIDEVNDLEPEMERIVPALHTAGVTGGFWLSTTADADKDCDTTYAQVGMVMSDRIAVQKEYGTVPQAVYPVYELKISRLNF